MPPEAGEGITWGARAVEDESAVVECVEAALGDSRRDAQVPVLGDQTGQLEFLGEADAEHTGSLRQRCRSKRAEGPIVEAAAVAQARTAGAEAEGGDEYEVETDL